MKGDDEMKLFFLKDKNPFLVLFILVIFYFPIYSVEAEQKKETVEQLLADISSVGDPGVQYVVVNNDTVIFSHSAGLANIKNKTPLTPRHTMAAFSMTKTITAIAVLQLVERGKIKLNDQASQYIAHPYDSTITISQLISHTAGIPNPIPLKWVHLARQHKKFDEKKALSQVLSDNDEADALPGDQYAYSNIGYWLLGEVIEKVSGQHYSDYVNENIFKPLNLTKDDIGFQISNVNNHAKGYLEKYSFMNLMKYFVIDDYVWGEYEGAWLHINNVYLNGTALGGAIGTATAFSRILQYLLNDNSVLLGEKVKKYLYTQQKTKSGENIDMTLGWHIGELNDIRYYYKEGGGAGFHCEMRIYPNHNLATVIMLNRTSFNTRENLNKLDSNFLGNQMN